MLVLLAALGIVGLVAVTIWFVVVPRWRPPLGDGETYGIDVSAHQGRIDWAAVASDRISFAYIKATEGGDFVDRRYSANWAGAGEAGLRRGAYHFFTLCRPGEEQARNFLETAPPIRGALPPAVDLELAGNCRARPSPLAITLELNRFLAAVERAWGTEVVLYVGNDYEARYPIRETTSRPVWYRRFLLRPPLGNWAIWQLHGYSQVTGIAGGADLNVGRLAAIPTVYNTQPGRP